MYLDTIEPILLNDNVLNGDLNMAILIINLLCSKLNFLFDKDNKIINSLTKEFELRFYLQNKFKFEINSELINYHKNYTDELNSYRNMFNLDNDNIIYPNIKYEYYSNNYLFENYEIKDSIFLPRYQDRTLIYNNILNNTNEINKFMISKKDIEYWVIDIDNKKTNYYNDVKKFLYTNKRLYIKILNLIYYKLSIKYKLYKYIHLKDELFELLNLFNTKEKVKKLFENIIDIDKYLDLNLECNHDSNFIKKYKIEKDNIINYNNLFKKFFIFPK